jgi:hypothetical protein
MGPRLAGDSEAPRGQPVRPGDLPAPACRLGYTSAQVLGILGAERTARFNCWIDERAADRPVCEGRDSPSGQRGGCGPHGAVVPASDLATFVARNRL